MEVGLLRINEGNYETAVKGFQAIPKALEQEGWKQTPKPQKVG